MTQLLDLPNELLIQIASNVLNHTGWENDPQKFRQVNRRIRDAVDKVWVRGLRARTSYDRPISTKFCTFANYITTSPRCLRGMRSIDLFFDRENHMQLQEDANFDDFRGANPTYFEGDLELKWRPGSIVCIYPHIVALISQLPHLEKLRLDVEDAYGGKMDVTRLPEVKEQLAASLKELSVEGSGVWDETLIPFPPLANLLDLPLLQTITFKRIDIGAYFPGQYGETKASAYAAERDRLMPRFEKASLSIERISIQECTMRNKFMKHLLPACRRITHFNYQDVRSRSDLGASFNYDDHQEEEDEADDDSPYETIDLQGWHEALLLHQNSLREITLDFSARLSGKFSRDMARAFLRNKVYKPLRMWPSFAAFHALRMLEIEYRRIRIEDLPEGLRHLRLIDCRHVEGDAEIDAWKRIKEDYCPHMQDFRIQVTCNFGPIQHKLKHSGFHWGRSPDKKSRFWTKGGFCLKVSFTEYGRDRIATYTDGTWDTGSVNSYDVKLDVSNDEDWRTEDGEEKTSSCEEEFDEDEIYNSAEEVLCGGWDNKARIEEYLAEQRHMREYLDYKKSLGEEGADNHTYNFLDTDEESVEDDEGYDAEGSDCEGIYNNQGKKRLGRNTDI